jgi:hypothetical protein
LIHGFNHSIIAGEEDERFSIESKYPEYTYRNLYNWIKLQGTF